jgi:hypothetical protein
MLIFFVVCQFLADFSLFPLSLCFVRNPTCFHTQEPMPQIKRAYEGTSPIGPAREGSDSPAAVVAPVQDSESSERKSPCEDSSSAAAGGEAEAWAADDENPLHAEIADHGHFIGVQPLGNLLLSDTPYNCRNSGLGRLAALSDAQIVESLLGYLSGPDLARLACANRAWYGFVYASDVDLWRPLVFDLCGGYFAFQWWWRLTYAEEYKWRRAEQDKTEGTEPGSGRPRLPLRPAPRHAVSRNPATSAQSMSAVDVDTPAFTSTVAPAAETAADASTNVPAASTLTDVAYPPAPANWPFDALAALYPVRPAPPVQLNDFYSDHIFQPWFCASAIMANRRQWEDQESGVERVDARTLTVEEFRARFERCGKPVVVENAVSAWPLWQDDRWAPDALLANKVLQPVAFACGLVDIPLRAYMLYARRVKHDESPIYLFDRRFGERAPSLLRDYNVPPYFQEDFYSFPQERSAEYVHPSFRWWLIGPERSGSSFHKDPLYTHAWNGLVSGKKKWILYPPHIIPPGIRSSQDHLQVAAPLSVAEWYLNFYHETRVPEAKWRNRPDAPAGATAATAATAAGAAADPAAPALAPAPVAYDPVCDFPRRCRGYDEYRPVEIVQRAGDLVFIPSQWWHTALNFEFSIAVTQNFLHESNYLDGLKFLSKIKQEGLRDSVAEAVEAKLPGLAARLEGVRAEQRRLAAEAEAARAGTRRNTSHVSNALVQTFKRAKAADGSAGSHLKAKFSFGF